MAYNLITTINWATGSIIFSFDIINRKIINDEFKLVTKVIIKGKL